MVIITLQFRCDCWYRGKLGQMWPRSQLWSWTVKKKSWCCNRRPFLVQSVSFGTFILLSRPVPPVCLGVWREKGDTWKKTVSLWVSKFWRFAIDEFLNVWQKKFWFHSIGSTVQVLKVPKDSCFFFFFFFLLFTLLCVCLTYLFFRFWIWLKKMKCNEKIFRFFHLDWVHSWLWRTHWEFLVILNEATNVHIAF